MESKPHCWLNSVFCTTDQKRRAFFPKYPVVRRNIWDVTSLFLSSWFRIDLRAMLFMQLREIFAQTALTSRWVEAVLVTHMVNVISAHRSVHITHSSWRPILSDTFILLPLSCGSGESSTGALWVRYWEEPWDFLCLWAFLMDFLVNPSTFSDAEMADILTHEPRRLQTSECIISQGENKRFLFCSCSH